ncbi:protein FAR1-RELATED SEQUENCE 5-like [Arachis hypogaea]|uniref:protein FAR1-RELATED SEQUENCE 5-like n=2 Tax=Arachis TaxID=3817 RepID=UPI0007AF229C|nr:protein FAR1-RELATED SEQUENCE 5-like [Arachis hypogaea]
MDSGSEGNSDFSGQWTDGWSSESEEEEEEVSKGLESPSRVCKDSETVERVDVFGEGDDGGRMPSSESPRGSGNEMSDDVDTSMFSTAAALADAEFHRVEDAYARYVEYAKATGFAVQKGDSIKDDEGNVVRKFSYCNRQGLREKKHYERADRKRAHKADTRTNCSAKFVVFLDKQSGKWRTKTFVQDHNHDLTLPAFTNVMAAHRNINEGDKAHIHSMHEAGFQTNQIMWFFAYLSGGYQNLHFIKKDVYNYIDDVRRSRIVQGNAAAAISYLKGKTEMDPLAVVMYTYCPENHLGHLFWSDGAMQYDYECFGDVLPKVVVTDGDESTKEAIRTEFPNATHRLCTWHLAWNAVSNIKDNDFCAAFKTAVYGHFEVEEFDQYWADMVDAFGLQENEWIWATYEKRVHWANAYLCDTFCAGLRTTSRREGINALLKRFIKSSNCLLELVENLKRVVKDYRNNEFIADYKSLYSEPVITTGLESIERAMSQIYTREIFFEVKK